VVPTLTTTELSLDLADEDDSGSSNSDNFTKETSNLTISGTAEANAIVPIVFTVIVGAAISTVIAKTAETALTLPATSVACAVILTLGIQNSDITISGTDNKTLTINPNTNLESGKSCYIEMASGVLTDVAGNNFAGIDDSSAWTFSAASLSTTVT
jgi:hypothetical protein